MQPEHAKFLADFILANCEREYPTTRKVIAAIPEAKRDYRPDPRSRSALELAWHIAHAEVWFAEGVASGEFQPEDETKPAHIQTVADVLAYYDRHFPVTLAKVKALSAEKFAQKVPFYGVYNEPAVVYLSFLNSHTTHHRGQLAAYLRPMGSKVPNIYGGSADEPFQSAAQA
ncbi:MAG: DinB family protein [Acidobacteria bacterium]|nr:DinB family protein [Acidobacteriota bacterium]